MLSFNEQIQLGEKLISSNNWRFSPGMLTIDSRNDQKVRLSYFKDSYWYTYDELTPSLIRYSFEQAKRLVPDLNDPATIGWVTFLLRELYESKRVNHTDGIISAFQINGSWGVGSMEQNVFASVTLPSYETEAEAIVAAFLNFK